MYFSLVTEPTVEPVSMAEAKAHCRIDHDTEDAYVGALIIAARQWVENVCGMALMTQTWDGWLDAFPTDAIVIPKYPVASVTSITYHSSDLVTSTAVPTGNYQVDTKRRPPRIARKHGVSWPSATLRESSGVVVRFVAGYTAVDSVPRDIKHAILLLIGQLYAHREPEVTGSTIARVGFSVDALLAPHRLW